MWPEFSESLENRVLLFGGPPDLSPLSIPNLTFDNGVFTATNPTISVNGTPTVSLQGTVTVANNQITAQGQVSAAFGGNQLLFGGSFVIPVGTAITSSLADTLGNVANRLPLGGTSLTFTNLTLGAGAVTFDATAKLPQALGAFELSATGVQVGASGITAATLGIADPSIYQLDLGGFKLNAQNLAASYDVASSKVRFNGLFNAPQLNTTVDLSGNRFLAVGAGPTIEFNGGVSIAGPVTIGGPWKLNTLDLDIAFQNNAFTTTGTGIVDTGGGNLTITSSFANNVFAFTTQGQAMFQLLGMDLTISAFTFTSDQSGGGTFDPKITVQGSLKLPEQFGNFTIAIEQQNQLTVDSTGVQVTGGTASFPGAQTFSVIGLLEVKSVNATLSFDFQNSEVKLQGSFTIPSLNSLTINLTGNNFAALRFANNSLDFAFVGSFTNLNIPIFQQWQLQNGTVTVNKPFGTSPGDINGMFSIRTPNNTTIGLGLAFVAGRVSEITVTNNNPNPDFTFFGLSANVTSVKFIPDINPGNDDFFEPQLELQGSASLPTSFGTTSGGGRVTFSIAAPEKFILNENAITLTGGSISIPAVNFNLLGLVKVSVQSLNVQFISTPTESLRISGVLKIPQLFNLTLDFDPARNRFIEINSAGTVRVNGSVSVNNVAIVPNVWVIKSASFTFNNTGPQTMFQVDASLQIPSGIIIGGSIKFVNGDLDGISLFADNLRVPLGATGVFLTRIDGGLQNLANPTGNPPLRFSGGLGLSFGPRITIPLPGILGGPLTGAIIDLTVQGTIDKNRMTVNGDVALIGNSRPPPPSGLATGSSMLTLDWNRGIFEGDVTVNVLGGFFNASVHAVVSSEGFFTFQGEGSVRIPNGIPIVGGISPGGGKGALYFSDDGNYSNDFIAAWGSITVPNPDAYGWWSDGQPYVYTKGLKIFFDGNYEIINSEVTLPPINFNLERAEFEIAAGTSRYLVTADWANPGLNPNQIRVQFQDPNTGVLTDVTQPGNGIVDNFTVQTLQPGNRAFLLGGVRRTGRYIFTLVPPVGNSFQNTRWSGGTPNEKPVITPTTGVVAANGSDVTISYSAFDPDDIAKIRWYADVNNGTFTGVPIRVYFNGQPTLLHDEQDRADSVEWRSAEPISGSGITMQSGTYFIYGEIDDNVNAVVRRYLPNPVTVDTNSNPHPISVRVSSTRWDDRFNNHLISRGLGDQFGFAYYNVTGIIPRGALDPQTLPWSNIDRITVRINKPVVAAEDAAELFGISTAEYPVTVQQDGDEVNIVIEIPPTASAERLLLRLDESIAGKYDDSPFDGNNDRITGDPALLGYNALHGDVNRDGTVNLTDFTMFAAGFFGTAASSSSSGYSPFADFDGSGAINLFDFTVIASNFGRSLPAGRPSIAARPLTNVLAPSESVSLQLPARQTAFSDTFIDVSDRLSFSERESLNSQAKEVLL